MRESKILIVGFGYVGKGAYDMFSTIYPTEVYDPYVQHSDFPDVKFINNLKSTKYKLAVVCLPTEMDKKNYVKLVFSSGYDFKIYKCDTSIVRSVVPKINSEYILIKSTVEPGETEKIVKKTGQKICHSPEFMGQSQYDNSFDFHRKMISAPWIILGGDLKVAEKIFDLIQPIVGPEKYLYYAGSERNAELIKTMENDFFAKKIVFSNEARNITEKTGSNWYQVREGWGLDPRVSRMHTAAFADQRGFGGNCLPKDVMARVYYSIVRGNYYPYFSVSMLLMNTFWRPNEMHNKPIKSLNDIASLKKIVLVKQNKERVLKPTIF